MANKIIKYNLTASGTIPAYIADGGYFPKANSNGSPQDWDMIDEPSTVAPIISQSCGEPLLFAFGK